METLKNQQIEENKIIEDTKNEYYIEHDIEYFKTMGATLDDDVTLGWYWIKENDERDMKSKRKIEAGLFDNEGNFKAEQKPLSSDANCILDANIVESTTKT